MLLPGGLLDIVRGRTILQPSYFSATKKIISIGSFHLQLESEILCFKPEVNPYLTSLYSVQLPLTFLIIANSN